MCVCVHIWILACVRTETLSACALEADRVAGYSTQGNEPDELLAASVPARHPPISHDLPMLSPFLYLYRTYLQDKSYRYIPSLSPLPPLLQRRGATQTLLFRDSPCIERHTQAYFIYWGHQASDRAFRPLRHLRVGYLPVRPPPIIPRGPAREGERGRGRPGAWREEEEKEECRGGERRAAHSATSHISVVSMRLFRQDHATPYSMAYLSAGIVLSKSCMPCSLGVLHESGTCHYYSRVRVRQGRGPVGLCRTDASPPPFSSSRATWLAR
ncbi:hypothetical protein GGS23DRAFT_195369 [Durotheca rogersii]|uniref:uncharacterized protein n=1 Tax=Durotheca rogersii TaxID=419775 RepID=UPI00221E90E7|nr:uncharacterized protein GGS23DRAFT_195369 [Durotheca rogersii]KAI5867784.1 hypothetical protein GGS23DRAFT_195369 [Durotheca rogersii]